MQFMRQPIEKSHSTLYSTSTKSMVSTSDSNNNDDDEDAGVSLDRSAADDDSSELSYNECDITLMDDDMCDAKNEAELMFFQVVEMLRYEQEVCVLPALYVFLSSPAIL